LQGVAPDLKNGFAAVNCLLGKYDTPISPAADMTRDTVARPAHFGDLSTLLARAIHPMHSLDSIIVPLVS